MGSKLSIDKHVSTLEDILSTDPALFSNLKVENNIPDCITQNIKIWRYYEDDTKAKSIKSAPVCLEDVLNADFTFLSNECYLVLFVYRKNAEETLPFFAFPPSMWGLVESYTNLTPRGLETPVASSEPISSLNKEVLESFLLPKRNQKQDGDKFEHMLFVWNGKTANPLMKAIALSKALEFDALIHKGKDPLLQVLFSGGYIKNKKLCPGKILQLDSSVGNQANPDFEGSIEPMKETIYLMKFLFPSTDSRSFKPSAFKERFLRPRPSEIRQDDEYVMMGDFPEAEEESEFVEESSAMDSPTSYGGRMVNDFDDFLPLESVRGGMGPLKGVPKLTLSINKTQQNATEMPLGSIGNSGNAANVGGDSKFKIPNLRLGRLGEESVNVEIKVETPALSEDAANESQERSEEVRQPASSDRTSESQDSRRRSDRRIVTTRIPMTNLPLGGIEQPKNDNLATITQINDLIKQGNFGGRESAIRADKQEYFAAQCSEVLEGLLYVAGYKVASNIKKLEEHGITHIINAAGDACENAFADRIKYLTYYIKDAEVENIECVFYDACDFIEKARQEGGRVLVHCVQGVSRSVTLCMSYLMLKHQYTFNKAYEYIRGIRGIASPNPAFWAQLCHFYNRLYSPFDSIPGPRVFCIGSYQKETPQTLVARLLPASHSLYGQKNTRLLDPRSVVILQAQHHLYVWVGTEIHPANRERYIAKAEEHIKLLQQHEHAHQEFSVINQGEESDDFWSLWENVPEGRYGRNNDWNNWLVDLAVHKNVEGTTIYEEQEEEEEEDESASEVEDAPPSLFCYPKLEILKNADMDELSDEENLLVLCTEKEGDKLVYVWRGANVSNEVNDEAYIADVIKEKWPDTDPCHIKVFNEVPNQESNSFMDYFH